MKVLFHGPNHPKNVKGLELMCASSGVELVLTDDDTRVTDHDDYDIVILNTRFIDPSRIHEKAKIIFGPQHFVFPKGPLSGPLNPAWADRCVYNCLSPWVSTLFQEFGGLQVPVVNFPFSVDTERFSPSAAAAAKTLDCIVYIKHREQTFVENALKVIQATGLNYRIFKYGSYKEQAYLESLQQAKCMIVIDAHESQGFALQEAMATNVPLLVLNATTMFDEWQYGQVYREWCGLKKLDCTSVPYFSKDCGVIIKDIAELEGAIHTMMENYTSYNPRAYILETLSAKPCMKRILDSFALEA